MQMWEFNVAGKFIVKAFGQRKDIEVFDLKGKLVKQFSVNFLVMDMRLTTNQQYKDWQFVVECENEAGNWLPFSILSGKAAVLT